MFAGPEMNDAILIIRVLTEEKGIFKILETRFDGVRHSTSEWTKGRKA